MRRLLIYLFTMIGCGANAIAQASLSAPPEVDALYQLKAGQLSLTGEWAFIWNQLVPLTTLSNAEFEYQTITVPSYLRNIVDSRQANGPNPQGVATYVKGIRNLQQAFKRPALSMRYIGDAWEAWWIEQDAEPLFIGGSGKIGHSKDDEIIRDSIYILDLPRGSSNGRLVIYISSFHHAKGGFYGKPTVQEQETILRNLTLDLAARALLIGIGVYVIIQNLVFYMQRRKETVLLLLSIFCSTGVLRATLSSGYVDYFIHEPALNVLWLRLEYFFIVWPVIAALHYLITMFPIRHSQPIITTGYLVLTLVAVSTFALPIAQVTHLLLLYQAILAFYGLFNLGLIVRGIVLRMPDSGQILKSFIPLIVAIVNDIYASSVAHYNFYMAEYALFLFLFLQTQIQASRFVMALETSEHLTKNLQAEVNRKTAQLSERNAILEEKASDLKAKHEQVKLLSETDHLTGLFNRQSLEYRSDILYQMSTSFRQPLSVIMLDLDHFKNINDRYGHIIGDECLIFTASYLRGYNLRKRDLIARYGGEEIIIILPDTTLDAAIEIAEQLCNGIKEYPIQFENEEIFLTASFGVAELFTAKAISIRHLITCADQALYTAKQKGRDRVEAYQPNTAL